MYVCIYTYTHWYMDLKYTLREFLLCMRVHGCESFTCACMWTCTQIQSRRHRTTSLGAMIQLLIYSINKYLYNSAVHHKYYIHLRYIVARCVVHVFAYVHQSYTDLEAILEIYEPALPHFLAVCSSHEQSRSRNSAFSGSYRRLSRLDAQGWSFRFQPGGY